MIYLSKEEDRGILQHALHSRWQTHLLSSIALSSTTLQSQAVFPQSANQSSENILFVSHFLNLQTWMLTVYLQMVMDMIAYAEIEWKE